MKSWETERVESFNMTRAEHACGTRREDEPQVRMYS